MRRRGLVTRWSNLHEGFPPPTLLQDAVVRDVASHRYGDRHTLRLTYNTQVTGANQEFRKDDLASEEVEST